MRVPFLRFPMSVVISVLFVEMGVSWLMIGCAVLVLAISLTMKARGSQKRFLVWFLPMGMAMVGIQLGQIAKAHFQLMPLDPETQYHITGRIVGVPQQRFGQHHFTLRLDCLGTQAGQCEQYQRYLPFWPLYGEVAVTSVTQAKRMSPGQVWSLPVTFKPTSLKQNPGSFHVTRWMMANHLVARFRLNSDQVAEHLSDPVFSMDAVRAQLKQTVVDLQAMSSSDHLSSYPVLLALVTGDRSLMTDAHWDTFNRTGTTHLIAISGMHVGLVAGFAMLVSTLLFRRWLWLTSRFPASNGGAVVALLVALLYAAVAGFGLPVQRAVLMLTTFVVLKLTGRAQQLWFALSVAFVLVIVWDPVSSLSMGFWLSFLAVFSILWLTGGAILPRGWWRNWSHIQVGLFLSLAPILLGMVQSFSLVSIITNFVAIPAIGFCIAPLILVWASLTMALGELAAPLAYLAGSFTQLLVAFLTYFADWDFSVWYTGERSGFSVFLAVIGVFWLLTPGIPGRALSILLMLSVLSSDAGGRGAYILQAGRPQMALYQDEKILFISYSTWPSRMPEWQIRTLHHWGIPPAAPDTVEKGALALWQAKGLVATEYTLRPAILGQKRIAQVRYRDLCEGDPDVLKKEYGVTVHRHPTYRRHCAVEWRQEQKSLLIWPTGSIRSQQFLKEKIMSRPMGANVQSLVLYPSGKEKIVDGIEQLLAADGEFILIKPLQDATFMTKRIPVYSVNDAGYRYIPLP